MPGAWMCYYLNRSNHADDLAMARHLLIA
jgi:hypothetical protein